MFPDTFNVPLTDVFPAPDRKTSASPVVAVLTFMAFTLVETPVISYVFDGAVLLILTYI